MVADIRMPGMSGIELRGQALEIMQAKRKSHFDSHIFDLFLESLPRFREIRRRVAEEYGGDPDPS